MFATAAPRRLIPGLLLTAACLLAAGNAPAATVVDTQRSAFKQAYASALQGGEQWRGQASELRDYPLYAYLEAASIEHDIRQTDSATVQDYLSRYPDAIPASDLRRHFLSELARRQDWSHFLTLYQPGLGDALTCQALQARVANGEKLNFERDLAALWAKPNLPGACDTVLAAANSQGLLTNARLWARIEHAIDAGQPGTAASLATWLPPADATVAQRLAQALRDPSASLNAATGWPNTVHNTQAVTLALARLARRQSTRADTAWQQLQSRFSFSTAQRNKVLHALALFHATDFDDNALNRLIALPAAAQTDASREWRVRVALARQNWPAVLAAIDAMPATQQADGEWRYFRARALTAQGRTGEAQQQLTALASEATFFGFLAADRVNQPYTICPRPPTDR